MKSLLGLDLAEKLIADASILENRLSARLASVSDDPNYKALVVETTQLAAAVTAKNQQVAALENERLRATNAEKAADDEFKQLGGPHWLDREVENKNSFKRRTTNGSTRKNSFASRARSCR